MKLKSYIFLVGFMFVSSRLCLPQVRTSIEGYKKNTISDEKSSNESGIKYYKNVIREHPDADSYYQLARLYFEKNTIRGRSFAREYIRHAIFRNPKNLKYRFLLAKLMGYFSESMAFDVYKDIINIDSTNVNALYNLGRIQEDEFDEYNQSVHQDPGEPALSFQGFAEDDFNEAKNYFLKALNYDPVNRDVLLHLSFLYEDNKEPEKGVPLLEKLVKNYPNDKDGHLYLGLLYYKTSQLQKAYKEYQTALILMKPEERDDFVYNSVKELLKPIFKDDLEKMTKRQIKEIIDEFWKISDPLYLTKYNERLLEHYSRVAYANLRFSVPKLNIVGWKSDRGETVLRYGEPLKITRYRPYMNLGDRAAIKLKTDVWQYKDMTFGFSDDFMSGNFRYAVPVVGDRFQPQFGYDSYNYARIVKHLRFEYYNPKFEGPKISVPYDIVQFRDLKHSRLFTDVYVNYALNSNDSTLTETGNKDAHKVGLFFFDKYENEIFSKTDSVVSLKYFKYPMQNRNEELGINSVEMKTKSDSGRLAFEIIRSLDKGVFSDHSKFYVRSFKINILRMSDIVLAYDVNSDSSGTGTLKRGNINIFPNPANSFSAATPLYIYYEVYNLTPGKNHLTDFVQDISISKKDDKTGLTKVVGDVLDFFGIAKEKEKVTLTSNYQTKEKNPQMYLHLDMSKYPAGEYILKISVKDKITGKEVNSEKTINWE